MAAPQQPSAEERSRKITQMLMSNVRITDVPPVDDVYEYKGYRHVPAFNPKNLEFVNEKWAMPENSIFICSFPKTGTAWTNEIVRQILYGRDEKLLAISKSIPIPLFALEMAGSDKFDTLDKLPIPRKFYVTHAPEELLSFKNIKERKGKMIYVLRNPKDQVVSWFHFCEKLPFAENLRKKFGLEWNDFFANFVEGKHPICSKDGEWYPEHILGWMKHEKDENFLVVFYEDMKKDFPREIRRISKFLDVDLGEDDVAKIADVCSISSMKKTSADDKSGFHGANVRKGQVGGWKDYFTVAQSELMDKLIDEKLNKSGINFTYVL